jgi:lipoprotein signal peptidase
VLASNDNRISIFLQICIAVYLALMLRRVYAARQWYSITVAMLIAWSFFHLVWLYRFLLFEITLHSL